MYAAPNSVANTAAQAAAGADPAAGPATSAPAEFESPAAPPADGGVIAADRGFDLSLRLLTALVLVALAGSVGLLAYRWLAPQFSQQDRGAIAVSPKPAKPAPAVSNAGPARGDEVLMDPGHVFRCEEQGRITFSDRACPSEAAQARGASAR
jgi:hypothetical protein